MELERAGAFAGVRSAGAAIEWRPIMPKLPGKPPAAPDAAPEDRISPSARRAILRFDPRPTGLRRAVAWLVATVSRLVMTRLNRLEVTGGENLAHALASGRGVITFSNHVSLFDDPFLTSCLTRARWEELRWVAADAQNFFGSALKAALFNSGKCVPIVRGAGVDQPGMRYLEERLIAGEWVHVFPEGGRTRDPAARLSLPFKTGLATLVRGCRPLLLPFLHEGMQRVLPIGARLPRIGQTVTLCFGAIEDAASGLADRSVDEIIRWAEQTLTSMQSGAVGAAADAPPVHRRA